MKYDFMGVILQALRKSFTSLAQSAYKKDEQRGRDRVFCIKLKNVNNHTSYCGFMSFSRLSLTE